MTFSDNQSPGQQLVSTQRARQGVTGYNVRYVLGFSLAAAIIVLAIIWLTYFT